MEQKDKHLFSDNNYFTGYDIACACLVLGVGIILIDIVLFSITRLS
jgi:hypothetical protein